MINHEVGSSMCAVGAPLIDDEVLDFVSWQAQGCTQSKTAMNDGMVTCVPEVREKLGVKLFDLCGFILNTETWMAEDFHYVYRNSLFPEDES